MEPTSVSLTPGVTFVISALNEQEKLPLTLLTVTRSLAAFPDLEGEIVVINDGSTDRTGEIAEEAGRLDPRIRVIHHRQNQGMGRGVREGISVATKQRLFIVPGDNDLPEATIRKVLERRDVAEMVICYFLDREKRGRWRNFLSTLFGLIYLLTFDVYVAYINGPALYPTRRLKEMTLRATRFTIVAEINVKLLRTGVNFLEIDSTLQTAGEASTAVSWRNLGEVMVSFCEVVNDVFFREPAKYRARPQRVLLP